ncbi:UDP-glucose 6-dehydrogenase, partial [Pelagibacteraceae bacterium GOM-A3]
MKICMIGSGYVGLVSGACFAELGNNVICLDKNLNKISNLKNGVIPIYEPGLEELIQRNVKQKRLQFSTNISKSILKSDIIFICVGTPTKIKSNEADLKYIFQVVKDLKKNLNKYKIIVTKSTVPVTTGDKIQKLLTTKTNKKLFDVVSNPEFLREGEAIRDFMFPDRVVVGTNSKKANNVLKNLYSPIIKKKGRYFNTSRRAAEVIKYAANAFLATKITFINEIANLCEKLNVDVTDVSLGIGTDERIGARFLRAGPGYGGSCFPKDTRALISTSKKFKTNLSIVKSTINSNVNRYKYLLTKIKEILNNNLKSKKITFLGVTFKAGTDDMRDSASLKLIPYL